MNIHDRWSAMRIQLRDARRAAGLTQENVARKMTDEPIIGEERRSWLSRLENGRGVPHLLTVLGWARAVGLDVALVSPRLTPLLELEPGEVAMILRAARDAADGKTVEPLRRYRVREALAKLRADA